MGGGLKQNCGEQRNIHLCPNLNQEVQTKLCKFRPSESISPKRELLNLVLVLVRAAHSDDAQATWRDFSSRREVLSSERWILSLRRKWLAKASSRSGVMQILSRILVQARSVCFLGVSMTRSGEKSSPNRDEVLKPMFHARSSEDCLIVSFRYRKYMLEFVVFGLEGLSPIRYGDYMRWRHDGQGTVMFPSAAIGRGVHSMVIACVPWSERGRLGCFTTDE
ncbi:hypothetical protein DEO72_LG8g1412 [Vigna unguiculata]|uniref:Uncharacterized protein n=1 Tax=Vigna unguiculata TaxID=3917 RepID=A0A4D6MQQ1_VIGUN|nr:hypothetical protein DEO72_LG8g1412 [Vigna unguiculata]